MFSIGYLQQDSIKTRHFGDISRWLIMCNFRLNKWLVSISSQNVWNLRAITLQHTRLWEHNNIYPLSFSREDHFSEFSWNGIESHFTRCLRRHILTSSTDSQYSLESKIISCHRENSEGNKIFRYRKCIKIKMRCVMLSTHKSGKAFVNNNKSKKRLVFNRDKPRGLRTSVMDWVWPRVSN